MDYSINVFDGFIKCSRFRDVGDYLGFQGVSILMMSRDEAITTVLVTSSGSYPISMRQELRDRVISDETGSTSN